MKLHGFYLTGRPWFIRTTLWRLAQTPLTVQQYLKWTPQLNQKKSLSSSSVKLFKR